MKYTKIRLPDTAEGARAFSELAGDCLSGRGVNNTMAKRTYHGVTRTRRLTKSEAAKYRKIRDEVAAEIPPAKVSPEKIAIAKLRAMREAKGISLSELAARTGITRGNLARLEAQKNATLRTLVRYAEGLDCELKINIVSANMTAKKGRGAVG